MPAKKKAVKKKKEAVKKKTVRKPLISKELLNILACPVCKGDLKLVDLRDKKSKIQGKLICQNPKCKIEYPIEDGIPIMLPPEMRSK